SRTQLYLLYKAVGCVSVYLCLMDRFEKEVNEYRKTNEVETKARLIKSISAADIWLKDGCPEPRPEALFARSWRSFWAIVNAKEGKNKLIKLVFSLKLHPCSVCLHAHEVIEMYER